MDDMMANQGKNVLWSIFDLEDGFHQLNLDESSWPLTTFVTPWGNHYWKVLPMGLKTAPAAYQHMVAQCLFPFTKRFGTSPYMDDILHGTQPQPPQVNIRTS